MKVGSYLVMGLVLASGCAGRLPEPRPPSMVRSFHGTLVPGYYVSPAAYQHYIQAQLLSNDGRSEEAVEELRHALASDGASPYLRSRLAEELLNLGRVDEAREEVEAALHLDPQFPEAYVDFARVKLRLGDAAGAEGALEHALEIDHACEEAYLALVHLYRERGEDGRLETVWRALARYVPGSAMAPQALGRLEQARGDQAAAERQFRRALELDPGLDETRVELAELLQGEGRVAEAAQLLYQAWQRTGDVKLVERIVRLDAATGRLDEARQLIDRLDDEGGNYERRVFVGWLRLAALQPERAQQVAEEVLRGGETGAARLLLSAALKALGRLEEAVNQLRKVPREARQYARAQERLGLLLRDGGRYREAIEQLGRAIGSLGGDGAGNEATDALTAVLAAVHERSGDRAQAIHVLEQALARRPQSESLAFTLGNAYARAGQWERAIETVRAVLRRDPDSAQALNFVGFVLADHGVKLDEAHKLLERAVALKPTDGGIIDSLGWLYVKQNKLDDAERLLLRADRLTPEDPEILAHLGELYVRKADRARALEVYRRALAHHPEADQRRAMEEQVLLLETGRLGSR